MIQKQIERILANLDHCNRIASNRLWQESPQAYFDLKRDMETCKQCGYRCEDILDCPICGHDKRDD